MASKLSQVRVADFLGIGVAIVTHVLAALGLDGLSMTNDGPLVLGIWRFAELSVEEETISCGPPPAGMEVVGDLMEVTPLTDELHIPSIEFVDFSDRRELDFVLEIQ